MPGVIVPSKRPWASSKDALRSLNVDEIELLGDRESLH